MNVAQMKAFLQASNPQVAAESTEVAAVLGQWLAKAEHALTTGTIEAANSVSDQFLTGYRYQKAVIALERAEANAAS
jgi:hypothetical protein